MVINKQINFKSTDDRVEGLPSGRLSVGRHGAGVRLEKDKHQIARRGRRYGRIARIERGQNGLGALIKDLKNRKGLKTKKNSKIYSTENSP